MSWNRAQFLFSCLIDADRTDTADSARHDAVSLRQHGRYAEWAVLAARLERELEGFTNCSAMDQLREKVSRDCLTAAERPRGAYTLTVPTGGGKTLASLRFALNHAAQWSLDRVIYVSPFTSIIDQNAEVARRVLEPKGAEFASIVLEHHSNLTPLKETWKSKVLSENWDAPVVFTTVVQFLEALFGRGTRAVRRMHQMASAVLIFDEIQTLPVNCVHLFNNALNFLVEQCGSTAVLCTATQPLLHRVDGRKGALRLDQNSDLVNPSSLFSAVRRNEIYDRRLPGGWEFAEAAQLALSEAGSAGSCLVIVNTKREARSIFKDCKTAGVVPVFHLSTSMCPAHRLGVLTEIRCRLEAHEPTICVSTQLIEAGVDISFGSCIRALAGIDSIAQAAGRSNRHGECTTGLGRVHVINLKGRLPRALSDIRVAQEAAERVLDENSSVGECGKIDLANPKLIEQYFRYYFFERRKDMDYPITPSESGRDDTLLNLLSENSLAIASMGTPPRVYLRQSFMTAANAFAVIDAGTQGIIVPYGTEGPDLISALCAAHDPSTQFRLLRNAQRFTVNVFPQALKSLQQAGALHEVQEGTGILYLEDKYYSDAFGLNEEGTEEMDTQVA